MKICDEIRMGAAFVLNCLRLHAHVRCSALFHVFLFYPLLSPLLPWCYVCPYDGAALIFCFLPDMLPTRLCLWALQPWRSKARCVGVRCAGARALRGVRRKGHAPRPGEAGRGPRWVLAVLCSTTVLVLGVPPGTYCHTSLCYLVKRPCHRPRSRGLLD